MSIIIQFRWIIIMTLLMMINSKITFGQGTCNNANTINLNSQNLIFNQTAISNEHWISFVATNDSIYLELINDTYNIQQMELYSGDCNNISVMESSSNSFLNSSNLNPGSTYFVKFSSQNSTGDFTIILISSFPLIEVYRNNSFTKMGSSEHNICEGDVLKIRAKWGDPNIFVPSYYCFFIDGFQTLYTTASSANSPYSNYVYFTVPNMNTGTQFYITTGVSSNGIIYDSLFTKWAFGANRKKLIYNSVPSITFNPSPNPACPLENIFGIPSGPSTSVDWGDGTIDYNNILFHYYEQTGSYVIDVTSTNMCGTASHQETVVVAITPDFEFTNQCAGNQVQFNDLSTCSSILGEWRWDFGDGMSSVYTTSTNPTHTYSHPGTYLVKLKVKTKYSQMDPNFQGNEEEFFITKQITIFPNPEPAIISGINNDCNGVDDIQYMVDNYQSSANYNWSISQGVGTFNNTSSSISTGQSNTIDWTLIPTIPSHAQIQILTTDNNGCQSFATKNIFECCEGEDVNFTFNDGTLSGSPLNYQGKRIMINGTLTIDTDVLFDEDPLNNPTQIFMGPEAKIVVSSGHQIEFINSSIQSNCEYMWDGIYTSGETSLIEFDNSELREAINGIVVDYGAIVMLKNSNFIDNYKSVQINNYIPNLYNPVNYSGEIYGCNFYNNNNVINSGSWIIPATDADYLLNMAPMVGKQAFAAISIKKVGLITIGDGNKNQNMIAKHQIGIYSETSEVEIVNNYFQYIKLKGFNYGPRIATKLPESAAIYSAFSNNKVLSLNPNIYIGDENLAIGTYSNLFENCDMGIHTKNYRNKIFRNKFLNTSNTAMYLYDLVKDGDIQYNYINNNATLNNARGILGTNTTQKKLSLNIANNLIYNMKWGISLTNCASFGNSLKVKVKNNQITLNPTNSTARYAIKVEACDRIEIQENNISRIGNSGSADVTKVVGISLRLTQSAKITDNYMYKMGSGIMTNGAMYNNQFFCNTMSMNYNGFYFGDNTGLTNFGWKNVSGQTDFNPQNKWVNNIGEKMYNYDIINQTPVNYYYYDQNSGVYSVNNDPEIGPSSTCDNYIIQTPSNSATFYCSNSNGPNLLINDDEITTSEERDQLLEEFLQGQEYEALQEQFRSYEIEYLYDVLDNDPSIMWLGGGEDEAYQEFYAAVQNTVNAKFIDVDNYIAEGDFENAYASNNAISPANSFEANRQQSNKIYLETYLKDDYMLAESTIDALIAIASQTPYEGGYGVYTARVMLDYDPDENGVSWRLEKPTNSADYETQIRVFPNPAKDVLFVEVMSKMDSYKANIQIYNSMGQLVAEQSMMQSMEFINLSNLKVGVYFYTIRYENGHSEKGKFIIEQ